MVKDGEMVVEIVPNNIDHAVELYVEPMDLMLLQVGQDVRLTFDGFPAVVFQGGPIQAMVLFLEPFQPLRQT